MVSHLVSGGGGDLSSLYEAYRFVIIGEIESGVLWIFFFPEFSYVILYGPFLVCLCSHLFVILLCLFNAFFPL